MKSILRPAMRPFLLSLMGVFALLGLSSCTTTEDTTQDTRIYPTPAEKNQQMQEHMSQMTRSFL